MKISLIQINSGGDKEANFKKAEKYIIESAKQNPDVICLPEVFLYSENSKTKETEKLSSNYIIAFQELAKSHNINLVLGSIILKSEAGDKNTNSSLIINRKGEIIRRYDKIYMYNVERNDLIYKESDITFAGKKLGIFELDGIKMGVGICVDLRYPEYFRELVRCGVEIIFLPSSFRKATGSIAWDVLTKARAIENQIYFCACNQTGGIGNKERCGNSRMISFDGKIISEIGCEEGVITSDLDIEELRKFRKEFPVLKQM